MIYCKNYKECKNGTTDGDICGIEGHECDNDCIFTCIECERKEEYETHCREVSPEISFGEWKECNGYT